MRRRSILAVLAALILVLTLSGTASAHDEHGHKSDELLHSEVETIDRDSLPGPLQTIVSDRALALASSPEFEEARKSWPDIAEFVYQVHYQLRFRGFVDYMPADALHIARVLEERPSKAAFDALGLHLTVEEYDELVRRQDVGDRIPSLAEIAGERRSGEEGGEVSRSENFAGVWQDQMDGGRLVVAVVDSSKVDIGALVDAAGSERDLRVIEVEHSWDQLDELRDRVLAALERSDLSAAVRIDSTAEGRLIQAYGPEPAAIERLLESEGLLSFSAVRVEAGVVPTDQGGPTTTHVEADQMPGLQIELDPGNNCTWGANGHTSSYNYLITAGHCGSSGQGFIAQEIHQNNVFHLTPGSQYFLTNIWNGYDVKRGSTPQADSNCYHTNSHCNRFIRWRTIHNSWEINSDLVCATLGTTNIYSCGYVREENATPPSSCTIGNRSFRYDIDTSPGDSGAGLIGPLWSNGASSIDGIHTCGNGTQGNGQTAYDTKNILGFSFNCASTVVRDRAPNAWASCPLKDR